MARIQSYVSQYFFDSLPGSSDSVEPLNWNLVHICMERDAIAVSTSGLFHQAPETVSPPLSMVRCYGFKQCATDIEDLYRVMGTIL